MITYSKEYLEEVFKAYWSMQLEKIIGYITIELWLGLPSIIGGIMLFYEKYIPTIFPIILILAGLTVLTIFIFYCKNTINIRTKAKRDIENMKVCEIVLHSKEYEILYMRKGVAGGAVIKTYAGLGTATYTIYLKNGNKKKARYFGREDISGSILRITRDNQPIRVIYLEESGFIVQICSYIITDI